MKTLLNSLLAFLIISSLLSCDDAKKNSAGEHPGSNENTAKEALPDATMVDTAQNANAPATLGMTKEEYIALISSEKLVLVDFYAEWCGPCKQLEPHLKKLGKELAGKINIVRINVDENPGVSNGMSISSIPSLKLYQNKKPVWQHVGYIDENELRQQLKKRIDAKTSSPV